MEENQKEEYIHTHTDIYTYISPNHSAVYLKSTQYGKSTILKKKNSTKFKTGRRHYWILPNRINSNLSQIIPKISRNSFKLNLWGLYYCDNKIRQEHHKKRKSQAKKFLINIDSRIFQENMRNLNSIIILKGSYIMIKWNLFWEYKEGLTFANQPMQYTTLTKWRIKVLWSAQ